MITSGKAAIVFTCLPQKKNSYSINISILEKTAIALISALEFDYFHQKKVL